MIKILEDSFGRKIDYIRLSVTDRCDLNCVYCLPKGFACHREFKNFLTFDEIERVIGIFGELGVSRVRLTGGEPLVRKGIVELAERLARLNGIEDLSMSTNARRMDIFAEPLKKAGISRINVSLDSLDPDRFREITGGELELVINGLMASKKAGFSPIKINMVLMKGINDHAIEEMVNFCADHGFILRFIETMPMGSTGREIKDKYYVNLTDVIERLGTRFSLMPSVMSGGGPARYFMVKELGLDLGFITPISQHFCSTCNRVRLSTDGTLYMCLAQNASLELRELLRGGISDDDLRKTIHEGITRKPMCHDFDQNIKRFMNQTGG